MVVAISEIMSTILSSITTQTIAPDPMCIIIELQLILCRILH